MSAFLQAVLKYDPSQPRAPKGTATGGQWIRDAAQHALETALIEEGVLVTSDVEQAVAALTAGRRVELLQPRQVATLLDRLAAIAIEAEQRGDTAPTYDLCKVTVRGTNLFCVGALDMDRSMMPQFIGTPVPGSKADALPRRASGKVDISAEFVNYLRSHGYSVEDTTESAAYLRASQRQLNGAKVGQMMGWLRTNSGPYGRSPPLVVSEDNYIIDGHHRWAALVGLDAEDNEFGSLRLPIQRVNIKIVPLLMEANSFADDMGVEHSGLHLKLLKYDPSQPRAPKGSPDGGQWVDAAVMYRAAARRYNETLGAFKPVPENEESEIRAGREAYLKWATQKLQGFTFPFAGREEVLGNELSPGDPLIVLRAQSRGEVLDGNSANSLGLARFLSNMEDWEQPANDTFTWEGLKINAYVMPYPKEFGDYYSMGRSGQQAVPKLGREFKGADIFGKPRDYTSPNSIWYSGPKDLPAKLVGSVSIEDVRAVMSEMYSNVSFDTAGAYQSADAIQEAFRRKYLKKSDEVTKFDPEQPRDPKGSPTGGQWTRSVEAPVGYDADAAMQDLWDAKQQAAPRAAKPAPLSEDEMPEELVAALQDLDEHNRVQSAAQYGPQTITIETWEYKRPNVRGTAQLPVIFNPTRQELKRWAGRDIERVRFLNYPQGRVFWDALEALHQQVAQATLFPYSNAGTPDYKKEGEIAVREIDVQWNDHLFPALSKSASFVRRVMSLLKFDESQVNRAKTTAESNDGSFAPKHSSKQLDIFTGEPSGKHEVAAARRDYEQALTDRAPIVELAAKAMLLARADAEALAAEILAGESTHEVITPEALQSSIGQMLVEAHAVSLRDDLLAKAADSRPDVPTDEYTEQIRQDHAFGDSELMGVDRDWAEALDEYIGPGYGAINAQFRDGDAHEAVMSAFDDDHYSEYYSQFQSEKYDELLEEYTNEQYESLKEGYAEGIAELEARIEGVDSDDSGVASGELDSLLTSLREEAQLAAEEQATEEADEYAKGLVESVKEDDARTKASEAEGYADQIKALIDSRPPTPETIIVRRGVTSGRSVNWKNLKQGDQIELSGFTSTSSKWQVANNFGPRTIKVVVPKGSKDVLFTTNDSEGEIIFNHGSKLTVLHITNSVLFAYYHPEGNGEGIEKAEGTTYVVNFGRMETEPTLVNRVEKRWFWREEDHPRHPAGAPQSQGGEFRPKWALPSLHGSQVLKVKPISGKPLSPEWSPDLQVMFNPTAADLRRWAGRDIKQMRYLQWGSREFVVVWNAYEAVHKQVAEALVSAGHATKEDFADAYWNKDWGYDSGGDIRIGDGDMDKLLGGSIRLRKTWLQLLSELVFKREWDESKVNRGKTTPESNDGSFAPKSEYETADQYDDAGDFIGYGWNQSRASGRWYYRPAEKSWANPVPSPYADWVSATAPRVHSRVTVHEDGPPENVVAQLEAAVHDPDTILRRVAGTDVLANPTESGVRRFMGATDEPEVRWVRSTMGNVYLWPAEDQIHKKIAEALQATGKEWFSHTIQEIAEHYGAIPGDLDPEAGQFRWRDGLPSNLKLPPALSYPKQYRHLAKREWDESEHPRGETVEGTNDGSFRPKNMGFVSPNIDENVDFQEASNRQQSLRTKLLLQADEEISDYFGTQSNDTVGIGAWADGAEQSLLVDGSGDFEAFRAHMALAGLIADQKAVVAFTNDANGPDSLYRLSVGNRPLKEVHAQLLEAGVQFHTLRKTDHNVDVFVFAPGSEQEVQDGVAKAAERFGVDEVSLARGRGEFIGSWETREEGRAAYEALLNRYESAVPGRDGGWQALRDRWLPRFQAVRKSWLEAVAKYNPDQPRAPKGSPDGGQWVVTAYHGSTDPHLLDPPSPSFASEVSGAVFYTSSRDVAEHYRYPREYGEVVSQVWDDEAEDYVDLEPGALIEAQLSFKNPLVVDFEGDVGSALRLTRLVEGAKAAGHDGIIIHNIDDSVGSTKDMGTTYVVFDAEQATLLKTAGSGAAAHGSWLHTLQARIRR